MEPGIIKGTFSLQLAYTQPNLSDAHFCHIDDYAAKQ
jgi:hypothetical protein